MPTVYNAKPWGDFAGSLFGGLKDYFTRPWTDEGRQRTAEMIQQRPEFAADYEPPEPKRAYYDFKVNGKPYSMPMDDVTRKPSDLELEQYAYEQDHKGLWSSMTEGLTRELGKKPRQEAQRFYEASERPDTPEWLRGPYGAI